MQMRELTIEEIAYVGGGADSGTTTVDGSVQCTVTYGPDGKPVSSCTAKIEIHTRFEPTSPCQ
jgi:hypothetical protein